MSFKEKTGKRVVLVGTYRAGQLERWPGLYNDLIAEGDKVDAGAAKRVNEIWLFNGAQGGRYREVPLRGGRLERLGASGRPGGPSASRRAAPVCT